MNSTLQACVADPHHVDVDPYPASHFDADPEPDPASPFAADSDLTFSL
jgi:hypothetical protein